MNDSVMILLAIVAVITLLVVIFRKNISEFFIRYDRQRLEPRSKTHPSERAIRQAHSATHSPTGAKPKPKKKHHA
jgi:hypothetical protein